MPFFILCHAYTVKIMNVLFTVVSGDMDTTQRNRTCWNIGGKSQTEAKILKTRICRSTVGLL